MYGSFTTANLFECEQSVGIGKDEEKKNIEL
jgi:hypothetical protein